MPDNRNLNCSTLYLVIGVTLVAILVGNWNYFIHVCDQSADYALIALEVEKAKVGQAWFGPYSRFHFRHPGPLVFYLYAGLGKMFPFTASEFGKLCLAQFCLNGVFIGLSIALFVRIFKSQAAGLILLLSIVITFSLASSRAFFSVWGPLTLLAPILCFLVASLATITVSPWYLVIAVISSSVAFNNHLGSLGFITPLAAILILYSLWLFFIRPDRRQVIFRVLLISSVVFLGLNAFAIIDAIRSDNFGNLGQIIKFASSSHLQTGYLKGIEIVGNQYSRVIGLPIGIAGGVGIALLPLIVSFRVAKRYPQILHTLKVGTLLNCLLLIFSIWSVTRTVGRPISYLFWYHYSAVTFSLALAGFSLWILLIQIWSGYSKFLTTIGVVMAVGIIFLRLPGYFNEPPRCSDTYDRPLAELAISKDLPLKVHISATRQWGTIAGFILRLYRAGYQVCVSNEWTFMYGVDLSCDRVIGSSAYRLFRLVPKGELVDSNIEAIVNSRKGTITVSKVGKD